MNLGQLNSISATYPGFQSLPKGVKKMLLVTESVFFEDARPPGKTVTANPHTFPSVNAITILPVDGSLQSQGRERLARMM